MTVQTLMNDAVRRIDDYDNIASYDTSYLNYVNQIIGELMAKGIGTKDKIYYTAIDGDYTAAYSPTDTDYIPVALPADLIDDSQIKGVTFDNGFQPYTYTEVNSTSLYLLIPYDYLGTIEIRYALKPTLFTALTDVLPISDDAAVQVAAFGLAAQLSIWNAPQKTNYLEGKYQEAIMKWVRRYDHSPRQIRDVYNFSFE